MKKFALPSQPLIPLLGIAVSLVLLLVLIPSTRHAIRRALFHSATLKTWHVGDHYTPLALTPVGESSGTVQSQKHHSLLINVFTSWCPPCKQELPDLERFSQKFKGEVDVVGVDQAEAPEVVIRFSQTMGIPYPIFIDDQKLAEHLIGVRVIPTTVLVGRDGVIRAIHQGPLTYADFVSMLHSHS